MLLKNVALIETIKKTGTGFIYPCQYNNVQNAFIVITNAHVLEEFIEENPEQNYKDGIFIHFYDDLGNKIERDEVLEIRVFNKSKIVPEDDIAALLIILSKNIVLTLENKLLDKSIDNRAKIYMEGYPGVMLNDNIYQKVQLEGQEKAMFPENKKIGIYQITDDYHWYNNFNDKKLIEGLSGSPVYYIKNEKKYILGISQSIADINQGENPFKIIYYLKVDHVLDYLRRNDCIIYSKVTEFEYRIVWIYGNNLNSEGDDITLLMIGGSGSGKSSFAKNFAYLGNRINSTSDGQTTRTKVIYQYSLFAKNSTATVKLLNKDDFAETMIDRLEISFFKKFIKKSLELTEVNLEDEDYFLNNIHALLSLIVDIFPKSEGSLKKLMNDIWRILRGEKNNFLRCDVYENIVLQLKMPINQDYLKYFIDENHLKLSFEGSAKLNFIAFEDQSEILNTINDLRIEYNKSKRVDFKKFQELQKHFIRKLYSKITENNTDTSIENLSYIYVKENVEDLFKIEGYFDITEFHFIFPDEYNFKNRVINEINISGSDKKLSKIVTEVFGAMNSLIKSCIKDKFDFEGKKKFDITRMNEKDQHILEQCLQVTSERSLTGIIDYVKIEDKISNEYAMIMFDLGINKIKLIDTCGLDHIEVYNKALIKDKLRKNLSDNEKDTKISYSEINVLYFKKLDSGKPDELRNILPIIREVIPASPVYCVFTGIDIFYKTSDEIKLASWKQEHKNNPKSINYILSKKGKKDFTNNGGSSSYSMYLTLKNNLLAYCGLKELERNDFQVYLSNTKHIRKILTSISMKEYSSLEIVDNSKNDKEFYESLKDECQQIIIELFSKASIHDKYYRWNTKGADISGHNKRNEVGYAGTYHHRINQLFHQAYADIMNNNECVQKILEKDDFLKTENAVYSSLKNMENKFIGNYVTLSKIKSKSKNEFRNIMELMYENGPYKYNPFSDNEEHEKYINKDAISNNRDEIFKDIFNFTKGLEDSKIMDKFTVEFVRCLKIQIDEDNEKKSQNMIKLNQEFVKRLAELKHEFIEKYSNDEANEEAEKRFRQLMSYYFKERDSK